MTRNRTLIGNLLLLSTLAVGSVGWEGAAHAQGSCTCISCSLRLSAGEPGQLGWGNPSGGEGEQTYSDAFRIGGRWSATATNGGTGGRGNPITLRWGFALDGSPIPGGQVSGESTDDSNLISYLDGKFGAGVGGSDLTQRPWFTYFSSSFDRWSSLAGLTYVYEPADDGATMYTVTQQGTFGGPGGQIGVRADVRIGGHALDGPSNVLAYNFFPNAGEMVIDTSETDNFTSSSNNFRFLRNTIMHEHGHGLGFNHVESSNSSQLMEPFLSTGFDGPQFDDILAAQRNYGDALEKNGGNDTPARASPLGTLSPGITRSVGTSASGAAVSSNQTDFVSIDDESDVDFFRISLVDAGLLTITLTPRGPTYNEGPQGGAQAAINTAAQSDLTLSLVAPDAITTLLTVNAGGLGVAETISNFPAFIGDYFIRVGGLTNERIQMYRLQASLGSSVIPEPMTLGVFSLAVPMLICRTRRG
jgi:hypothetical protein